MQKLRMLSLCSGIGGADLAAEWTGGIAIVGQVEIDPFCQAVLAKHWPAVNRMGDIQEVGGHEFGAIDLIVAGFPCQPHSMAGKRKGSADERDLWPEVRRIVGDARPKWFVAENVPGLLTTDSGRFFSGIVADLDTLGYRVGWSVYGACEVGAPHQRDRVFLVAYSASSRRKEFSRTSRPHDEPDAPGSGVRLAHTNRVRESSQILDIASGQCSEVEPAGICPWGDPASVADASGAGQSKFDATTVASGTGHAAWRARSPGISGTTQSRLGRDSHGAPSWLDRHRWPAAPGEEQEDWEPSRTIPERVANHSQRLKALGNAIVPQQIYPILAGIVEWEASTQ